MGRGVGGQEVAVPAAHLPCERAGPGKQGRARSAQICIPVSDTRPVRLGSRCIVHGGDWVLPPTCKDR
jgi:hypothetical protein